MSLNERNLIGPVLDAPTQAYFDIHPLFSDRTELAYSDSFLLFICKYLIDHPETARDSRIAYRIALGAALGELLNRISRSGGLDV